MLRERFGLRIKNEIDLAILRKNTMENLSKSLRSEGISIIARQSNDGRIYGMTFIDHKYQAVFNGSDLGRNYSAQTIQERCMIKPEIVKQEKPILSQKYNEPIKNNIDSKREISSSEKDEGILTKTNGLKYWKSY